MPRLKWIKIVDVDDFGRKGKGYICGNFRITDRGPEPWTLDRRAGPAAPWRHVADYPTLQEAKRAGAELDGK